MADKKKEVGVALGVIAAAAGAAAGYYFYASKDAAKNRKIAASWARDLRDDVIREARKVQDLNRAQMVRIIDAAAVLYETARSVDRDQLMRAVKELKDNWELLATDVQKSPKKRSMKKVAKKRAQKR